MQEEDFSVLTGLYDGAIAFLDARMRDLHAMLARRGALDDTLFIIMGDHGDSIGEHGLMSHKFGVYDTVTRVLLVIKYPIGTASVAKRHDGLVQHTDIVPTVLDLAGLRETCLPQRLQGNSLVSESIRHRSSGMALSELIKPFGREAWAVRGRMQKYDRRLFSIRSPDYKMIFASDGCHELYDLSIDAGETHNLLGDGPVPEAAGPLQRAADAHLPVFEACFNRHKHRI
jgi:arylsulfatase A-like enzyme